MYTMLESYVVCFIEIEPERSLREKEMRNSLDMARALPDDNNAKKSMTGMRKLKTSLLILTNE